MAVADVVEEKQSWRPGPLPPLETQATMVEEAGVQDLLFCRNAWALSHRFSSRQTGETIRARCNSWSCLYCGPRKVDGWRRKIEVAQPALFVTLSRAGRTVEEAARTLTTVVQYLRRGSKGRGCGRVGARPAYPIEFFATLEQHSNVEEVGFHWHLLVVGVDYLPKQVVSEALRSATMHLYPGGSYIVDVRRVHNFKAVGYVTKYLTKDVYRKDRGVIQREQVVRELVYEGVAGTEYTVERMVCQEDGTVELVREQRYAVYEPRYDEQGQPMRREETRVVEQVSKAHRVRYSKRFFPGKTKDIWALLCEGLSAEEVRARLVADQAEKKDDQGEQERQNEANDQVEAQLQTGWALYRVVSLQREGKEARESYEQMRRAALVEALEEVREGRRKYSRRVVSLWKYQRMAVA